MPANQYMQPFFDTLSQGVQVAQSLRQAAMQQQQLQQARDEFNQQQQLREQEFGLNQQLNKASLIGQGAQPVSDSGTVNVPTPQGTLTPGPDGTLQRGLAFNGPATAVSADPSRPTVSIGDSTLQVPTYQDRMNQEIAGKQALEQGTEPTAGQIFGNELPPGADPNVRVPNASSVLAGRAYAQGMRQQQPAGPKLVGHQITTDDQGNQTLVRSWDDGSVQETPLQGKGKSAASERGGADKTLTPDAVLASRNKALEDYQKSSKEEAQLNQDRLTLGTALKSGQHYVDRNGNLKRFDPAATPEEIAAQQDNMKALLQAKTTRLEQVIADKNDAMQRYGTRPQVSTADAQRAVASGSGTTGSNRPVPSGSGGATQPAAPAPSVKNAIAVGQTATNPKTKQRVQWNGTAWLPIQ